MCPSIHFSIWCNFSWLYHSSKCSWRQREPPASCKNSSTPLPQASQATLSYLRLDTRGRDHFEVNWELCKHFISTKISFGSLQIAPARAALRQPGAVVPLPGRALYWEPVLYITFKLQMCHVSCAASCTHVTGNTPYFRHSVKRLLVADGKSLILTCVWGRAGLGRANLRFNVVYFVPFAICVAHVFYHWFLH